jgi:hypothetical protein
MSALNLSAKQINQSLPKKLNLVNLRGTRERHGDYYLDGKFQFTATLPNEHGGSGAVSTGWLKVCRESVFLNAAEYADLVRCPMESDDYEKLIRERIVARRKTKEQGTSS